MNRVVHPARAAARRPTGARALRQNWLVANACFAVFLGAVLVGTTPFVSLVMAYTPGEGDPFNQVLFVLIAFGTLVTVGVRRVGGLPVPVGLAILLGYCALSIGWAVDPLVAIRRLTLAVLTIFIVFQLVNALGARRTLVMVRWALALQLALNFAMVFFTPFGVHTDELAIGATVEGTWRGILLDKNTAGACSALTVILFLFDNDRCPRRVSAGVILASLVFLAFTGSRSSQAFVVVAALGGLLVRPFDGGWRTLLSVLGLTAIVFAILIAFVRADYLDDLLASQTALSGRTLIWSLLLEYAGAHGWTGAGFGSFWGIGRDSPIWTLTSGWVAIWAPHGHNGYLDLLVTIGLPGLVLAVLVLFFWPLARLFLNEGVARPRRSLLLALMLFCAGHNLMESSLLIGAVPVEVFLMLTIALIYRHAFAEAARHRGQGMGGLPSRRPSAASAPLGRPPGFARTPNAAAGR